MGDLVYIHNDRSKLKARDKYLVVRCNNEWIRKFTGNQLRAASYKVKRSECYKVPSTSLYAINEESDDDDPLPLDMLPPSTSPGEMTGRPDQSNSAPEELKCTDTIIVPLCDDTQLCDEESLHPSKWETTSSWPQRVHKAPDRLNINWK